MAKGVQREAKGAQMEIKGTPNGEPRRPRKPKGRPYVLFFAISFQTPLKNLS